MAIYKGQKELSQYITESLKPTLIGFLRRNRDKVASWHEEKINDKQFRILWSERFDTMYETIKATAIKKHTPTKSLLELCQDVVEDVELHCERKKTKRHLEVETLKTQRCVATASNKRLRTDIENEATSQSSSQQSQSSYEPNTESSEDEISNLEPTWDIGNFDLSTFLVGFRTYSIGLHRQFLPLSNLNRMAINHTYLFDNSDNSKYDCRTSFPPIKSELLSDFNLNEHFTSISDKEHGLMNAVNYKLVTHKNKEAEEIILSHMSIHDLKVCCKVLYNLLQTYTGNVDIQAVDESMYINLCINPFLDVIFGHSCGLIKAGNFTKLEGNNQIKPDIKYSAIVKQEKMDFLVIEVKCPSSKATDDLFKLSVELIILLNRLVTIGVDFPVVFGILVYGYSCDIYKMDLKAPTIYRMIKIRSCYIPRDLNDFDVVRNTIAALTQLYRLIHNEMKKAKESKSKLSKCLPWIRDPSIDYKEPERK